MHHEKNNQMKLFGPVCTTITLVITVVVLTTNTDLASAQNKTSPELSTNRSIANATKVNIILVHGFLADASEWDKIIPILLNAGHKVIAVQLPLHSLSDDVATVKRAIDLLGSPTILVGHSYGGMVITNAAYNNPNVKGLVYIAALAPKQGQSCGDFIDITKFPKGYTVTDKGRFVYLNPTFFRNLLAQDVNSTQANIMAVTQKPFNMSILTEKSGPPAWKQHRTWYQVSENDRSIPPALQHTFAKQMNATTISIPSSHLSLVSHPKQVAQLILNATKGVAN
jgi:pimeloyl-ACP methyl ester carboxylesterase